MRDKDDEMMNLRERLKRAETESKAATERYELLKNQDGRSRGSFIQFDSWPINDRLTKLTNSIYRCSMRSHCISNSFMNQV